MTVSWFLWCAKPNYLIDCWCDNTNRYYENRTKADMYFFFHELFVKLYNNDPKFANIWNSVHPKLSEKDPHILKYKTKFVEIPKPIKEHIIAKKSYVYKLDHNPQSDIAATQPFDNAYTFLFKFHNLLCGSRLAV